MKNLFFAMAILIATFTVEAQVKTPAPSPKAILTQTVGLTEVTLDYSRPSSKGRIVFGDLVPFGKLWRTGANGNSTITFSDDVVIKGTSVPKGKYAIFTTPKADMWEVILYSATDNWGTPENWDAKKVVVSTNVDPMMLNLPVETLTMSINNISNDSATLDISWEKTMVSLKFEVPTKKSAMASIDKVLSGPGAADYFSSAQYLYSADTDVKKALEYVNKAVAMAGDDVPFWHLRLKSLIQAKAGDKMGAIATAKQSLASAEKAKNADYVKMNNDSIKEWSKR